MGICLIYLFNNVCRITFIKLTLKIVNIRKIKITGHIPRVINLFFLIKGSANKINFKNIYSNIQVKSHRSNKKFQRKINH